MLDAWLSGDASRLCREAPVPVVDLAGTCYAGGGAANTAANLAALGTVPTLVATVGDDWAGRVLGERLAQAGVRAHLLPVAGRRTVVKRRLVVDGQVVARFDEGDTGELAAPDRDRLARRVGAALCRGDTVVVCDYAAGTVPDALVDMLAGRRDRIGLLAVDARELRRWRPVRPDLVTPSLAEAARLLRTRPPQQAGRIGWVTRRLPEIRDAAAAGTVAVTLDADGTVVLDPGDAVHRTRTVPAGPGRAAGAGDTYLAGFVAALLAGESPGPASEVAQAAASTVLDDPGTGVCTAQALRGTLARGDGPAHPGRVDAAGLRRRIADARAAGHRIVFTNGCFDVLHHGHVGYLEEARKLGDMLVVAVNSDESVRRLKGPGRPVNPVDDRAAVLAALSCVDCVAVFAEDSPEPLLRMVRPDVYVKGGDYPPELIREAGLVRDLGGEVRTLSYLPDRSTSSIIDRIRRHESVRQQPTGHDA